MLLAQQKTGALHLGIPLPQKSEDYYQVFSKDSTTEKNRIKPTDQFWYESSHIRENHVEKCQL